MTAHSPKTVSGFTQLCSRTKTSEFVDQVQAEEELIFGLSVVVCG